MNPNIETINPHLMGVRFDYIQAGFITDLTRLIPKQQMNNPLFMMTVDGVLILDKNMKLYDYVKDFFSKIMRQSDGQVKKQVVKLDVQRMKQGSKFDSQSTIQLAMLKTEQARRETVKLSKGKSPEQLERELRVVEEGAFNGDAHKS